MSTNHKVLKTVALIHDISLIQLNKRSLVQQP